jgi:hypothetical protein
MLSFAHELLRAGRVVPQIGRLGEGIQFFETGDGFIPVKDASAEGSGIAGFRRQGSALRHASGFLWVFFVMR